MQNVIGEQYIIQRRRPVRISLESGLVHPASNGRIERSPSRAIRRAERRNPEPRAVGFSGITEAQTLRARRAASVPPRASALKTVSLGGLIEALASPKIVKPIALGIGLLALAVAVAAVSVAERPADLSGFSLPEDGSSSAMLLDAVSAQAVAADDAAPMPSLPLTLSMSSYRVVKNDTLEVIARRYGLRLDTLISANGIGDVRRIVAGSTLKIPSMDGVAYSVRKGESLSGIASARGVSVLDIVDANDLSSQTIQPGQTLFIPGARLSSYDLKKALGSLVIWPFSGRISSSFGYRPNPFTGIRQFHNGIDIAGSLNSSVKAAMDGRVAETGYSAVFGNFVILTHPEGYQTLYAHLNKILVKQGEGVRQGGSVGLLGSTGYSTGPHVHFGVFKRGIAIDPLKVLK